MVSDMLAYKVLILPRRKAVMEPDGHRLLHDGERQADGQYEHDPCHAYPRPSARRPALEVNPDLRWISVTRDDGHHWSLLDS